MPQDGQSTFFSSEGEYLGSVNSSEVAACRHRNAKSTGETCSDGCCDYYHCPDCDKRFLVECPD